MFARIVAPILAAAALTAPVAAQEVPIQVYPYESRENYCPAGLQPVTYDGAISCGKPNQSVSYQSAMQEPRARYRADYRGRDYCPAGTKGCR